MKWITFLFLTLTATATLAASDHHSDGVPLASVFWQAFNLSLVFIIIYFATRKTIPEIFRQRQAGYVASAKKAEEAKIPAEKQYLDIKHRLEHLSATQEESLSRAQAEAADLRKQLIGEAQDSAKRIREDAETTVKMELQRAQRDLHERFVKESIGMARQVLSKDIATVDHQKLQTEFAKNIEAVSP